MIFIENKGENTIKFPKVLYENRETYNLFIESKATNFKYVFEDVADEQPMRDYYTFTLDFSEIPDGEYEYSISHLVRGVIQVGKIVHRASAYTEDNTFKEYLG